MFSSPLRTPDTPFDKKLFIFSSLEIWGTPLRRDLYASTCDRHHR